MTANKAVAKEESNMSCYMMYFAMGYNTNYGNSNWLYEPSSMNNWNSWNNWNRNLYGYNNYNYATPHAIVF